MVSAWFSSTRIRKFLVTLHIKGRCDNCTKFAKEFEAAATALKDVVPVYAVNDEALFAKYNVNRFPDFKIFLGKGNPADAEVVNYTGARNVADLVSYTMRNLNKHVKSKVPAQKTADKTTSTGPVVELSEADFHSKVLSDKYNQWLILFYAPWCGHCRALQPEWHRLSAIASNVKIGSIDATIHTGLAQRYSVKGYPTIYLFPQGTKGPQTAILYNSTRKAEDMLEFARRHYKNIGPPVNVGTVTDLEKRCSGPLCLLFFLPDDSVESHIETISKSMEKNSTVPFQFCYALASKHPYWVETLRITSLPALVGLNLNKSVFSTMRKEKLTYDNINAFISEVLSGRVSAERLTGPMRDEPAREEL
ncbi:protein disulfide-isomerase A6 like protein [Babesia gibsoni]|uniref:Protein disulfide-isomerase A6 like protein n=1 Tax=Babesia gibsoni TaxID=33632 RepID=A0AAD8PDX6_BABGI|nr:protein disulfide-isomerase A6 like protein [Babesia gibsoni]